MPLIGRLLQHAIVSARERQPRPPEGRAQFPYLRQVAPIIMISPLMV